jgi:hypothetical protein
VKVTLLALVQSRLPLESKQHNSYYEQVQAKYSCRKNNKTKSSTHKPIHEFQEGEYHPLLRPSIVLPSAHHQFIRFQVSNIKNHNQNNSNLCIKLLL